MSSLFRIRATVSLLALAGVSACERESRHVSGEPRSAPSAFTAEPDTIFPNRPPSPLDRRAAAYQGNAAAIAKGQQLYTWMNCVGCHSHGGGGMGPPLMDDKWRYGGRLDQVASSIYQGRPNGMPAWRGKLTDEQIWQLAAYVLTLSGQSPKDAVAARPDTMNNTPPNTQTERLTPIAADSDQQ